jgi:tetratricopeptide (TPR) repeat protein
LQGSEHLRRYTPGDFAKAISFFEKAIKLDPNYWGVYAALAWTYWTGACKGVQWSKNMGVSSIEGFSMAYKYMEIAMKNPTSTTHQVASSISLELRQYEKAIFEADRAIFLDPNDPTSHEAMARALIYDGRPEEAIAFLKIARRLDPGNIARNLYLLGLAHFVMGNLEEAINSCERALKHNPELHFPHKILAVSYGHLGRKKEALASYDSQLKGWPDGPPNLITMLSVFPFKTPEVYDRFAEGWNKAGLPDEPSGYYKILEQNRLSGEEIKKILVGRAITGIHPLQKIQWWHKFSEDEKKFEHWTKNWKDIGKYWLEGDLVWLQYEKLYGGVTFCYPIYRNPEGKPEEQNEYLKVSRAIIRPFSPVD